MPCQGLEHLWILVIAGGVGVVDPILHGTREDNTFSGFLLLLLPWMLLLRYPHASSWPASGPRLPESLP